MTPSADRFTVLDAWRGVAALMVALTRYHTDTALFSSALVQHAYLFVDFFFVLSGFVIAHAYGDKLHDGISALRFMIRRFGRLWPLHVSLLALFVAGETISLLRASPEAFTGSRAPITILADITLTEALGFFDVTRWNTPSWSISTEFWAYAVFALVWLLARRQMIWVSAAIIAIGLLVLLLNAPNGMDATFRFGFARCLAGFFTGVLVQAAWRASKAHIVRPLIGLAEPAVLAIALAFVWLAGRGNLSFAAPLFFALMVYVFAFEAGPLSRLLRTRPFQMLGEWSYSIYMTALAIALGFMGLATVLERLTGTTMRVFRAMGDDTMRLVAYPWSGMDYLVTLVYLAVVITVSALTYRFIEAPGRRWFNARADRIG